MIRHPSTPLQLDLNLTQPLPQKKGKKYRPLAFSNLYQPHTQNKKTKKKT